MNMFVWLGEFGESDVKNWYEQTSQTRREVWDTAGKMLLYEAKD